MKTARRENVIAASLVGALAFTTAQAQELPTSGSIKSRLGKIELKKGYPTDATVKKMYDDIDFQRACQAYLWALPLMAWSNGKPSSTTSSARAIWTLWIT
jgi:hypothetical protein